MGSYTSNQRYYLIDGDEFVDVDRDINYNLDRADLRVRSLVEYQKTDVLSITDAGLIKDIGFKWYKTYTNSIWVSRDATTVAQDGNAFVPSWSTSGITFETGYSSLDQNTFKIGYSIFSGFVRLRGSLALTSGADLPLNTTTDFMTLPDACLPTDGRNRYFLISGGKVTSDFQVARLFIPHSAAADKRLEFCRYGGAAAAGFRYLNFNDVYYPLSTA